MAAPPEIPAAGEDLARRLAAVEAENARLKRINESLMDRVERDMDMRGNSFSLFQAASALEGQVQQRTAELRTTLAELEHANRELHESNEAAQAASRAKSAFLAAMSHELRTPMNGVVGMTEVLLSTALDAAQRRSAELIRRSALSLLQILNDILDFSKIEAGRMDLESARFDLRKAVDGALQLLRPQAEGKGITLQFSWPQDLPSAVVGDPTRFTQIVTNLIGNAIKFTAHGGVTVRAQRLYGGEGRVRFRFEVQDTGIGIKPEVIPRLFESFTQSDVSITRKFGGTGLGLAIVRRLCRLMDGDCGVTSEFGHGSCFWFTLELGQDDAPAVEHPTGRHPVLAVVDGAAANRRRRVLLVEDNSVNQEVARSLLELLQCDCTIADNGARAVELLVDEHEFDVVLMDCQMPEMDGFEATRRVRTNEAQGGGHVPIVALTANAMVGDRELCLAAGMDDFLSKPFTMAQLRASLRRWHTSAGTPSTAISPTADIMQTSSPGDSLPILDSAAHAALGFTGNDALLKKILTLYRNETPKLMAQLRTAGTTADLSRISSAAHSLKSSSRNVGGMRLGAACEACEMHARAGRQAEAIAAIADIERESAVFDAALADLSVAKSA